MIVDDGACGDAGRKIPFEVKHPVLRGLRTIIFGIFVVALIDIVFYKIGGLALMEKLSILPISVGVLFVLKGYFQMIYPTRY
jgi:hypothetical protein